METEKDICPVCNGTGLFEIPHKIKIDCSDIKKRICMDLHNKGYSMRQIQLVLGYKSVRSIHKIITDIKNKQIK